MPVFGPWALKRPHRMPVEDFFGAGVVLSPLPTLGKSPPGAVMPGDGDSRTLPDPR